MLKRILVGVKLTLPSLPSQLNFSGNKSEEIALARQEHLNSYLKQIVALVPEDGSNDVQAIFEAFIDIEVWELQLL